MPSTAALPISNRWTPVEIPMLIGGAWRHASDRNAYRERIDPYRGNVIARVPESDERDVDDALTSATRAAAQIARMPGYERAALLKRIGQLIADRHKEIALAMTLETGKAISDSLAEVVRSPDVFELAAAEAIRIEGEQVPIEGHPAGAGKFAFLLRFPVGVVAAITPFNSPLNLAAHKIAPAIAAGNAVVLKPAPQAPLVAHKLAEIFVAANAPDGLLNVVYGDMAGPILVRDPRVNFISFTGSGRVGAQIRAASGLRRVTLELGGNGSTIVHADADIDATAKACAHHSVRLSGQSCVSVQNIYVHDEIADLFIERLVADLSALQVGDPLNNATDVGTLIDEAAAQRVESWVSDAIAGGARKLIGGQRVGAQFWPTVLTDVNPAMKVVCDEVFGPVVNVIRYRSFNDAIAQVNASPFGLQVGVFVKSTELALLAVRELRCGGIIINGTSRWRTDQGAYGGVKNSGIGREGPKYAIRDMTEERLVVFNY